MRRIMEEVQAVIRTFARGGCGRMLLVAREPENSPLFLTISRNLECSTRVPPIGDGNS